MYIMLISTNFIYYSDAIIPLLSVMVGVLVIATLSFFTQQKVSMLPESDERFDILYNYTFNVSFW